MLERYTPPTKFDLEPYGTVSKVIQDEGKYVLYVQLSEDKENPHWIRTGEFLELLFNKEILSSEEFRKKVLDDYHAYLHPKI